MGGLDDADVRDISGGFVRSFTLEQDAEISLTFRYHLRIDQDYEADEFAAVLASVDGRLLGQDGEIDRLQGDGDGGVNNSTGWQEITLDLGRLSAGEHVLKLGGFNNKKTSESEFANIAFDDVALAKTATSPGPLIYDLARIEELGGLSFGGAQAGDRAGASIGSLGNGDLTEVEFILLGAPSSDPDGRLTAGEVVVASASNPLAVTGQLKGLGCA